MHIHLPNPSRNIYKFAQIILGVVSSFPFPYEYFPVYIGDFKLSANRLDRFLALWYWKMGGDEPLENQIILRLCKPGMHVVDIGANIGRFSIRIARAVGADGHVWSFEPETNNFRALVRNIHYNRMSENISVIKKAVGAQSGCGILYVSPSHGGEHRSYFVNDKRRVKVPIEIISLDDYFPTSQHLDLIKLDVQGAEGQVLNGMQRILKQSDQLTLIMEFWPDALMEAGSKPLLILEQLTDMGYKLSIVNVETNSFQLIYDPEEFVKSFSHGSYLTLIAQRS